MYEHRKMPLISFSSFMKRMVRSLFYGILTVLLVIICGVLGFHYIEGLTWIDAFLESSMFFAGLGSPFAIKTYGGKLFAAFYAILCPFGLITAISILLLPLLHRFMHKFHISIDKEINEK